MPTYLIEKFTELRRKKIIILENSEYAQVIQNTEPQKKLGFFVVWWRNEKSIPIIQQSTQNQQRKEFPAPPAIKKITGQKYKCILHAQFSVEYQPIQDENDGQKNKKLKRIKKHI